MLRTKQVRSWLTSLIAIVATFSTVHAQEVSEELERKVQASLVLERTELAPGKINYLGIRLQMAHGWHVYFDGLNDSGLPLQAEWTTPDGVRIGKIIWPAPKRKIIGDFILDHIYEKDVLLLVPVRVQEDLEGARVEIRGQFTWMVCDEICLMESDEVSLVAEVSVAGAEPPPSSSKPLFDRARGRLPGAEPPPDVRVAVEGASMVVRGEADELVFYPGPMCTRPVDLISDGVARGGELTVRFDGEPERMEGLIEIKRGDSSRFVRINHPEQSDDSTDR